MNYFPIAAAGVAGLLTAIGASEASALDTYTATRVGTLTNVDIGGFELDGGFAAQAAFGLDGLGPFRGELSATYAEADAFGVINVDDVVVGGTLILDLPFGFSAGAGVDYFTDLGEQGHHLQVGWSRPINDSMTFDATWSRTFAEPYGVDLEVDAVMAGVRWN